MKLKRALAVILSLCMVLVLFSPCGSKSAETAESAPGEFSVPQPANSSC